jgi:glycosyltransferase involved in cell wall biosynthesis
MSTSTTVPISACIITFNEADRIEDCLRSLAFCDEILVVDSHSTDATREYAARCGARVIERDWPGYRSQKEFAVKAARHDWVLCVDADERVTPELRAAIERRALSGFASTAGFLVCRITEYFGCFLRHGNAYPDRLIRLFDRRRGGFRGYEVHENTWVDGPVVPLEGYLEHFAYRSLADQIARLERYSGLMATEMQRHGKRAALVRLVVNPWWRFVRGYLLRLGFLDGWRGLVFHLVEAGYVRDKYLKLFLLQRGVRLRHK